MTPESSLVKIGLFDPNADNWMGGSRFIRTLCYSLGYACRTEGISLLHFVYNDSTQHRNLPAKIVSVQSPGHWFGERYIRQVLCLPPNRPRMFESALKHKLSVLLSMQAVGFRRANVKTIGWIPDFQHMLLPEFFSEESRRSRDRSFQLLAKWRTLIMLSSHNALEHFAAFAPRYADKGRVASFPSLFVYELSEQSTEVTREKFNLPGKFALVANQFWRHKNHEVVLDAIGLLRRKGNTVHVVMTGAPVDSRDRDNETLSRILQKIASAGLNDQIRLLGKVPFDDLVSLMRAAAVVIQPSRFEGWSSVVQDCKALGRPLLCSDIPVHREQAKDALAFFPWDSASRLAQLLADNWSVLDPGPDPVAEARGLAREREFARAYGQRLLSLCREAESR